MAGAAGAVEPKLDEVAVILRQLGELGVVIPIVSSSVVVARVVAIPRRQIDAEFQPVLPRSARDVTHHVALAVLPRTRLHAVVRLRGGPEAETIMMFGDEDHILRACPANGLHPLVRIESRGIEDRGAGGAVAPFAIQKSIGREVNDDAELKILPLDLLRSGFDVGEVLRTRGKRAAK